MKKLLLISLMIVLLFSVSCIVNAQYTVAESDFKVVRIPFPDSIKENDCWRTVARYKDSGEAITLSAYYNGYIYATIPKESENREIEAFVPDKIKFTDYDSSKFEFFELEELSRTGVILGNEKGEAKPFDNVTRAEATAMIMRTLGIGKTQTKSYEKNFSDVNTDDWFYPTVMEAYKCGIVVGDSEITFSPKRNVTREEITVMTARALKYAGLKCPARKTENISDKENGTVNSRSFFIQNFNMSITLIQYDCLCLFNTNALLCFSSAPLTSHLQKPPQQNTIKSALLLCLSEKMQ